jgi:hypothetical protein
MVNRDYTKEVGIDSSDKIIPWPFAAAVFALMAVGGWYGVAEMRARAQHERELKAPPAEPTPTKVLAVK